VVGDFNALRKLLPKARYPAKREFNAGPQAALRAAIGLAAKPRCRPGSLPESSHEAFQSPVKPWLKSSCLFGQVDLFGRSGNVEYLCVDIVPAARVQPVKHVGQMPD
jgi:hypothetical protein